MKKVLVLGASPKADRYSHMATLRLQEAGWNVIAVGRSEGKIGDVVIQSEWPEAEDLHTVTLYLSAENQRSYQDLILQAKPERIIMNPGAENSELAELAHGRGIEVLEGCTLVMLSAGTF